MEISAIDRCREVRSFAPLPVEWPDQSIQLVDEARSESVSTLAKDFPGKIRLLQVNADRLETGDVARAIHKYVVRKRDVLPPLDPAQLTIPKNVKGELKPFVQESPFIETTHAKVKKLAASIEVDASAPAWNQVEMIYDAIRERFPYEFDPTIRSCPDAIEAGKGDCEELTSLFIAVCRIRKIPARAVWIPGHTYAEFYLVDAAGEGHWYPCQLAGTRLFGEMQEARPILQKGDKFTVPLSNKPTRYVAPQLLAAEGACSLSWIARQAEQPAPKEPSR